LFRPRSLEKRYVKDGQNADCLDDHLFCAVMPTQNIVVSSADRFMGNPYPLTPQEIVLQNLRELCVHDALHPYYKSHWFKYMYDLLNKCLVVTIDGKMHFQKMKETCHDKILNEDETALKLDMSKYLMCYTE
jgi:hypothetical protein